MEQLEHLLLILVSNTALAAALGGAALLAMRLRHPAMAHALWILVLLKLLTPPLWNVSIPWPRGESIESRVPISITAPPESFHQPEAGIPAVVESSSAFIPTPMPSSQVGGEEATSDSLSAMWLLAGVWIGGSIWCVLMMLVRVRRFHRLMRCAVPAPVEIQRQVARLCRELAITRPPRTLVLSAGVSPMLWFGGASPRLILPTELLSRISTDQTRALLVHELAHLARRDHWCRVLEMIAIGVYWWHPLAWFARSALREAEEQCCDAWVVSMLPDSKRSYATALVDTLDFLAGSKAPSLPSAATGLGRLHNLQRRLSMIFTPTPLPKSLSLGGRACVLALLAALPLVPVFAQQAAPIPQAERPATSPADLPQIATVVDALLEAISVEQNENVKQQAMMSIAAIGRDAAPPLVQALGVPGRAEFAQAALINLGTEAVPALVGAISSDKPAVRLMALRLIHPILQQQTGYGMFAPRITGFGAPGGGEGATYGGGYVAAPAAGDPSAEAHVKSYQDLQAQVAPLAVKGSTDTDVEIRRAAVALFQVLPDQTKVTMPALVDAMKDKDAGVRQGASTSLVVLASVRPEAAASAIAPLAHAVSDGEVSVRTAAIAALTNLGPAAKPALPALIKALKDREPDIRAAAAQAIGQINSAAVQRQQETMERLQPEMRGIPQGAPPAAYSAPPTPRSTERR